MQNLSNLSTESFRRFILTDENRRGNVICFKGEANTTLSSFFEGLFSFIFTRRVSFYSSYNDNTILIITNNYIDRIKTGQVNEFSSEIVEQCIYELKKDFQEKNKGFWSQNTTDLVKNARNLQRAMCYLNALNKVHSKSDLSDGDIKKYKNPDNSIEGAFDGAFRGFFGGMILLIIGIFIASALVYIIINIVDLFN